MADKYLRKNIALLINQSAVIAFLVFEIATGLQEGADALVLFGVITVLLAGAAYITLSNIKDSPVLFLFSGLFVSISWYFLFTVSEKWIFQYLSASIMPVIIFGVIKFVLRFIFQGDTYAYKKQTDIVFLLSALLPIMLKPFSEGWFALLYLFQYIVSFICCIAIVMIQRKRVLFFLKSEWKNLLPSLSIFCALMLLYATIFRNESNYLENSGLLFIICLPLWSVFKIAFKGHKNIALLMPINAVQGGIMVFMAVAFLCGIAVLWKLNTVFILLALQAVLWFLIVCYVFLTWNAKKSGAQAGVIQNNLQTYALSHIEKEEELKIEFSNFLHDDVLQDLLSLKNLMGKSERPEVRELIGQTLENLNMTVREQMQDYHPVLLKSLSLKENYENLISAISRKSHDRDINVIFDCADNLFLTMPYNLVVYRMIKELVTNAYKHSDCSRLRVLLTQIDGQIELTVKDNGNVSASAVQSASDSHKGKGLFSLQEQTALLGGQFSISENELKGLCVRISLPMKGEGSYQYFIGR